jgi:hypothetical protein
MREVEVKGERERGRRKMEAMRRGKFFLAGAPETARRDRER